MYLSIVGWYPHGRQSMHHENGATATPPPAPCSGPNAILHMFRCETSIHLFLYYRRSCSCRMRMSARCCVKSLSGLYRNVALFTGGVIPWQVQPFVEDIMNTVVEQRNTAGRWQCLAIPTSWYTFPPLHLQYSTHTH